MVFNVIKSREIFSHLDGKTYTSTREYEKSLHTTGHDVMTDKNFKQLSEKLHDERGVVQKPKEQYNHVHIDFNNGRVEKSIKDHKGS